MVRRNLHTVEIRSSILRGSIFGEKSIMIKHKFKLNTNLIISMIIVIALLIFLTINKNQKYTKVCFNDKEICFRAEVADSEAKRQHGLMFRKNLKQDEGMLFIFPIADTYAFWMKNTLIPLDIIWINENREIVFIKKDAQPCKNLACDNIIPTAKALYVFEINSGLVEKFRIKEKDTAMIIYNSAR